MKYQASERLLDKISSADTVLIHTTVQRWDIHIAEAVELVRRCESIGARWALLTCNGGLSSCPSNPNRLEKFCTDCRHISGHLEKKLPAQMPFIYFAPSTYSENPNIPDEFMSRTELLNFRFRDVPIGRLVASQMADDVKDYYFELENQEMRRRATQLVSDAVQLYLFARHEMRRLGPTKVFVWNGRRPSDGPVYYAAKSLGLDAYSYISGGQPGRLLCTEAPSVQEIFDEEDSESLHALEATHREALLPLAEEYFRQYRDGTFRDLGYRSIVGRFQLDAELDGDGQLRLQNWKDSDYRLLVVTSSPIEFLHTANHHATLGDDPYQWIAQLQGHTKLKDASICVRWHPNQSTAGPHESRRINEIMNAAPDHVVHIPPGSSVDTYALANSANIIIASGSTVALWATWTGKRVISIGYVPKFQLNFWEMAETSDKIVELLIHENQQNHEFLKTSAALWMVYLAERGARMEHVTWINDKPALDVFGNPRRRAKKRSRLLRHLSRVRRSFIHRMTNHLRLVGT